MYTTGPEKAFLRKSNPENAEIDFEKLVTTIADFLLLTGCFIFGKSRLFFSPRR